MSVASGGSKTASWKVGEEGNELGAMAVALNRQHVAIASAVTPDWDDYIPDTLTRIAVQLGVTEYQADQYCQLGFLVSRFERVGELLRGGSFSLQLMLKMADDLAPVDDENVDEVDELVVEALRPTKPGQAMLSRATVHARIRRILGRVQPDVLPDDGDGADSGNSRGNSDSGNGSGINDIAADWPDDRSRATGDPTRDKILQRDSRDLDCTEFFLQLPKLEAYELEITLKSVAKQQGCSLAEALMRIVRRQVTASIVLNLYKNVAYEGEELFAADGWLSTMASREWMERVTHLAAPGFGESTGYTPSETIRETVMARDGHCRFPGCSVPAHRCQTDHIKRYDHENPAAGGPTSTANLHMLCPKHHRLKTAGQWDVTMDADGTETWTSHNDGHQVITTTGGPLGRDTFRTRAVRRTKVLKDKNNGQGKENNQGRTENTAQANNPDTAGDTVREADAPDF